MAKHKPKRKASRKPKPPPLTPAAMAKLRWKGTTKAEHSAVSRAGGLASQAKRRERMNGQGGVIIP